MLCIILLMCVVNDGYHKNFDSLDCIEGSKIIVLQYPIVRGNVVRSNVYHKYTKDFKLNIIIDLDGFIY